MFEKIKRILKSEKGYGTAEYVVLIIIISALAVAGGSAIKGGLVGAGTATSPDTTGSSVIGKVTKNISDLVEAQLQ